MFYNALMGGLLQPHIPGAERESNLRPILAGLALVAVVVGIIALLLRSQPKPATAPHPYAANLQLSDMKMSAAENFVGASVSYLDGTVTNKGDQTITHAVVHVVFKNSLGENVQVEDIPLRVLQTTGPYPDPVDLNLAPLAPGQ